MKLSDFDALSFDCYGTLIDWETGIAAVLDPWARVSGLDTDTETLLGAFARHEAAAEHDHPGEIYPEILARTFKALGDEIGAHVSRADAEKLAGSVPDWPAFADSHDALVELGRRYQLIVLSNIDRRSFAASRERLAVTFTAVDTAEDVGSYKPAGANFDALLDKVAELGIDRSRLGHVAQSLFHDHVPAKAVGLPTIWINRRHDRPGWGATPGPAAPVEPDWEFPSMRALAAAASAG
jgi:putative hydrolase of the HAD superfamily